MILTPVLEMLKKRIEDTRQKASVRIVYVQPPRVFIEHHQGEDVSVPPKR